MTAADIAMPRRVPPPRALERVPPVSNARLAMAVLVASETMLFAGLMGAYLVFRLSAGEWPPADLPRLPLGLTMLNTVVLVASVFPLLGDLRRAASDASGQAGRGVRLAAACGAVFLAVQGFEWARLVRHGLTLGAGTYGGSFYLLIGCHALHVAVAVAWLGAVAWVVERRTLAPARRRALLEPCAIYWVYVVGLWVALFTVVYVL